MGTVSCWMTLHSIPGLENLGFPAAHAQAWLYNSNNNEQILHGQMFVCLGSLIINENIHFLLERRTLELGCIHLLIEIFAEVPVGRVDIGLVRLPLHGLVRPGRVMPASSQIRSTAQGYPMCVLNVSFCAELLTNYPHPPAGPYAAYPNPGYPPAAPQQYQLPTVFVTIVSHFLGWIFGQIGSGAMNQDMFANGFSIEDLITSYFM